MYLFTCTSIPDIIYMYVHNIGTTFYVTHYSYMHMYTLVHTHIYGMFSCVSCYSSLLSSLSLSLSHSLSFRLPLSHTHTRTMSFIYPRPSLPSLSLCTHHSQNTVDTFTNIRHISCHPHTVHVHLDDNLRCRSQSKTGCKMAPLHLKPCPHSSSNRLPQHDHSNHRLHYCLLR